MCTGSVADPPIAKHLEKHSIWRKYLFVRCIKYVAYHISIGYNLLVIDLNREAVVGIAHMFGHGEADKRFIIALLVLCKVATLADVSSYGFAHFREGTYGNVYQSLYVLD